MEIANAVRLETITWNGYGPTLAVKLIHPRPL
jgi:hypothetical protein